MPPEELAGVPKAPASLAEACDCLAADADFLLRGDVFTDDVIATWLKWKREREVAPMRLRPHPYEFCLYFDA
jgi:glutamine synthetase